MSSYGRYYRPALKNSVDVQLQTAFSDGNWSTVIRLAAKRAQSLKDVYYEAIRACAESQLDGPSERSAALLALDVLVRNPAAVPDIETLDLYEWACRDAQPPLNYSETLGALRSRWVKANPRSALGVECLKACIQSWDLINAQQVSPRSTAVSLPPTDEIQIAATLDKAAPNTNDRRYMFWNVTLTYLLSISPQCPEGKSRIYGMLATKLVERAAEAAETAKVTDGQASDRSLREEEELILFYHIIESQGPPDAFLKSMRSPSIGALRQFEDGRKHLLLRGLAAFAKQEDWDNIYNFCAQALSKTDASGSPSFLAADWQVWKLFIEAASKQSDEQGAFNKVQELLQRLGSVKSKVAQMYVKNISLASVEFAFRLPTSLLPLSGKDLPTPRVLQVCLFLDQHYNKLSTFDDIKGYVGELSHDENKSLLEVMIPKIYEKVTDKQSKLKAISLKVLALKFRYYRTTCPQALIDAPFLVSDNKTGLHVRQCKTCGSETTARSCSKCLRSIIKSCMTTYRALEADTDFIESVSELDRDPRADLSLVAAMCLLKLAGLRQAPQPRLASPLRAVHAAPLLQAVALLDSQLAKTPNEVPLRLLLVQLHLLLGCASYAYQLWMPMDVKRTIQDALSPLFFDRLASISPGLLFHGGERRPLMEPLRSYFAASLGGRAPVKIWDAFAAGSYSAVLDMVGYMDRLRRSCTLVMTAVEERRATRAFGGRLEGGIDEVPMLSEVTDHATLVNVTDYGSLPNLESSSVPSLAELVRIGPGLSNERSHLALLTEQYLDVVEFKAPKDYKPSKASEAAVKDTAATIESVARIQQAMSALLHGEGLAAKLTGPEETYYSAVSLLCAMLLTALTTGRSGAVPPSFALCGATLRSAIDALLAASVGRALLPATDDRLQTFRALSDHHTLSALRDTALAVRHTVALMQAFNEREAARDRSGKSGLHKEVAAEARVLDGVAAKALAEVRNHVKALKEALGQGGWLDQMTEWTLGTDSGDEEAQELGDAISDGIDTSMLEDWAGRVVESWREGVKGWSTVKLE